MNQSIALLDFISNLNIIHNILQPTLADLITFDYTAYETARQIFLQNMTDVSEESPELRKKAQQLMRVLKYRAEQKENNRSVVEVYRSSIKQSYVQNNKSQLQQTKIISSKQQPKKAKQIEIKVRKNTQIKAKQKSCHFSQINFDKSYRSEKEVQVRKYRDENVDNSNFANKTYCQPKQSKHTRYSSNREELQARQFEQISSRKRYFGHRDEKIVELNKIQYKKKVPIWDEFNKQPENEQENKKNDCQGNCVYMRFQCCCKSANKFSNCQCQVRNESMEMKINEFQIGSPSCRDRSYNEGPAGFKNEQERSISQNRKCNRVQRPQSKLKTEGNMFAEKQQYQSRKSQTITRQEQACQTLEKIPNKKFKHHHKHKQQMDQEVQTEKIQTKQNKSSKIILKKQLDNIDEDVSQLITSRQKEMEEQQRKVRELLKLREKQREEEKKREQDLLLKLREQFSEICFKEQTEDEKKVNEQIKQLEIKLDQMVSYNKNKTYRQTGEDYSPKAKVVRLDLTPSRSNLHRNAQYFTKNQSQTPRSPASCSKGPKLLSKKIEQATRAR